MMTAPNDAELALVERARELLPAGGMPAPASSITHYPVGHSPRREYLAVRSSLYFDKSRRPGSAGESHWLHLGQANHVITSPSGATHEILSRFCIEFIGYSVRSWSI
jgi:hypothetical protein